MKGNSRNPLFYLLTLDLKKVRLFKASKDKIDELFLADIPKSLKEAIGKDEFEKQLQAHTSTGQASRNSKAIYHGHGVGTNHYKDSILSFFRRIDKGLNKILQEKDLPLVIAGVDYLLPIYKKANKYLNIINKGIIGSPERIDLKELQRKSLPIVASYYLNLKR